MPPRARPNILVTGTPGTGKTSLCERVASITGFSHVNVSEFAKQRNFVEEYDEELDTYVIDEDKVLDEMEVMLQNGGAIVDYHSCDMFPERWFDRVFVLTANNRELFDRLQARYGGDGSGDLIWVNQHTGCAWEAIQRFVSPLMPKFGLDSGYSSSKVQENVQCEIMQVVLSEAYESYQPAIITVLQSDTVEQMESNVAAVVGYIRSVLGPSS